MSTFYFVVLGWVIGFDLDRRVVGPVMSDLGEVESTL